MIHDLAVVALSPRYGQLGEQIRQPYIADGVEVTPGGHAQGVGDVGFTAAGGSEDDDIVVLVDVIAGAEPGDESFIQLSVGVVLNVFETGSRL